MLILKRGVLSCLNQLLWLFLRAESSAGVSLVGGGSAAPAH